MIAIESRKLLCVSKLRQDWFSLLELLAEDLNPQCKFHTFNLTRPSEIYPLNANWRDEEIFAKSPDIRAPRGWLVELINRFGKLNGFQLLLERFQSEQNFFFCFSSLNHFFKWPQAVDVLVSFSFPLFVSHRGGSRTFYWLYGLCPFSKNIIQFDH